MTFHVAQRIIEEYLYNNWTDTSMALENTGFDPSGLSEFVRVTVIFGEPSQRDMGKGLYRQMGIVDLTVFTKPGTGVQRMLELSSSLAGMVRLTELSAGPPHTELTVKFFVPTVHKDLTDRNGWVQANVSAPFYYDWSD